MNRLFRLRAAAHSSARPKGTAASCAVLCEPDWAHPVDLLTFMAWYSAHAEVANIGRESIYDPLGKERILVSTAYFGLSGTTGDGGHPHVWETMIFGGVHDQVQQRYTTRAAAQAGHARAIAAVHVAIEASMPRCSFCHGTGQMYRIDPAPLSALNITPRDDPRDIAALVAAMPQPYRTTCTVCGGRGRVAPDANKE